MEIRKRVTPKDVRVARANTEPPMPIYVLAAEVRLHPGLLGRMIAGKVPMPEEIAQRAYDVLQRQVQAA